MGPALRAAPGEEHRGHDDEVHLLRAAEEAIATLDLSRIQDDLLVSNAPTSAEDVGELAAQGVTAVLSLQTDDDLTDYGLRWDELERWYASAGITPSRVPIRDYSSEDLAARLDEAVRELGALLTAGHTVCVHCTMGINRSPTVAIAYLVQVRGLSLAAALTLVTAARPRVQPDLRALGTAQA